MASPKDYGQARLWFQKAVDAGETEAMYETH
jgi:TPR repeat protein